MSLTQALLNRSPLIWVDTQEPERVIDHLPSLADSRDIYIFDMFQGLQQWDYEDSMWKTVLVEFKDDDGETHEVPIESPMAAWQHIFGLKHSIYIVRNVHKGIDDYLTMFSTMFGTYRNAFWSDNLDDLGNTFICLATGEDPPAEISAMTTRVSYGLPSKAEIRTLVDHVASKYRKTDILEGENIDRIVHAAAGMSELSIIELFLASIRSSGRLESERIQIAKLDLLKSQSILDISRPKLTLDDVGGLDNAKSIIRRAEWIWKHPTEAEANGLAPLRRVLLLGLPGTGKSMLCEAAAGTLGMDLARAGVAKAMNRFVGESERRMEAMFQQINALAPLTVWVDELGRDLSGGGSSDYVDGGTTSRVHATFLSGMQELNKDVFLFAAANDIDSLAPEMLRADRFDKLLFVGFPSHEERVEIFKINLGADSDFAWNDLAAATPCFTGAEIKALVGRVRFDVVPLQNRPINTKDLLASVDSERNRLWVRHRGMVMSNYARAVTDYEWASLEQRADAQAVIAGKEPGRNRTVSMSIK